MVLVSCCTFKNPSGTVVAVLGDYGLEDDKKASVCGGQLVTCIERFEQWGKGKARIEVVVPFRPDLLGPSPAIDPAELSRLVYRIPLWVHGRSAQLPVTCADTRDAKSGDVTREVLGDLRGIAARGEVLEQWVRGEVRLRNLGRATWRQHIQGTLEFVAKHRDKKNPTIVRQILDIMEVSVSEEYLRKHRAFGGKGLSFGRMIIESFKRCRKDDRASFLRYFRRIETHMGEVVSLRAVASAVKRGPKCLYVGPQTLAQSVGQLLKALKFQPVQEATTEHIASNKPVPCDALAVCLAALVPKKKKKKRRKKEAKKGEKKVDAEGKQGGKEKGAETEGAQPASEAAQDGTQVEATTTQQQEGEQQ